MMHINKYAIEEEIRLGGPWMGAAHSWMQWNIFSGDRLEWGSNQEVSLTVKQIESLCRDVAVAAIRSERIREKENRLQLSRAKELNNGTEL
jgi:hypothetical protein